VLLLFVGGDLWWLGLAERLLLFASYVPCSDRVVLLLRISCESPLLCGILSTLGVLLYHSGHVGAYTTISSILIKTVHDLKKNSDFWNS
jgi:hypothetical protein